MKNDRHNAAERSPNWNTEMKWRACLILGTVFLVARAFQAPVDPKMFIAGTNSLEMVALDQAPMIHNTSTTLSNEIDASSIGYGTSTVTNGSVDDRQRTNNSSQSAPVSDASSLTSNMSSVKLLNISWENMTFYTATVRRDDGFEDFLVKTVPTQRREQSLEVVNSLVRTTFKTSFHIDRIYYINLDERYRKRALMESWLSKQPIPYQRIPAIKGEADVCVAEKKSFQCHGVSGLARSNVFIMDNLNTSGISLVVEDDVTISDMEKLMASVHLVPSDWDVLRWDCWDVPLPGFQQYHFSFRVGAWNTTLCMERKRRRCRFFGGTHITMWKGGAPLERLRALWGTPPYGDIDGLLRDPSVTNYCINVGVGAFQRPLAEKKDIPTIRKEIDPAIQVN